MSDEPEMIVPSPAHWQPGGIVAFDLVQPNGMLTHEVGTIQRNSSVTVTMSPWGYRAPWHYRLRVWLAERIDPRPDDDWED